MPSEVCLLLFAGVVGFSACACGFLVVSADTRITLGAPISFMGARDCAEIAWPGNSPTAIHGLIPLLHLMDPSAYTQADLRRCCYPILRLL